MPNYDKILERLRESEKNSRFVVEYLPTSAYDEATINLNEQLNKRMKELRKESDLEEENKELKRKLAIHELLDKIDELDVDDSYKTKLKGALNDLRK